MKTVIEMAREAGIHVYSEFEVTFERFAELVRADEREACAKICDVFQARDVGMQPAECAGAVRARSRTHDLPTPLGRSPRQTTLHVRPMRRFYEDH